MKHKLETAKTPESPSASARTESATQNPINRGRAMTRDGCMAAMGAAPRLHPNLASAFYWPSKN